VAAAALPAVTRLAVVEAELAGICGVAAMAAA